MIKKDKILKFSILLLILFIGFTSQANATVDAIYNYAKDIGGSGSDYGKSVVTDSTGNLYTVGSFSGTVDFDPGAGTSNLTSIGDIDIFIEKLDSDGNFVWVKQVGGTGADRGNAIAIDASNNLYIGGAFVGTTDFDPGAGTANLTSASSDISMFILKLDSSGNYSWAKGMGGNSWNEVNSIAVDSNGVYTTGIFAGTTDFDPGAGTANLIAPGGVTWKDQGFISKLDLSGNYAWAASIGGTDWDTGNSIYLDASGNVYSTGYFEGTADFDPSGSTANLTAAGSDEIYVTKYDKDGNYIWAKSMGGTGSDLGANITVDSSDNVYVSGYFNSTADFDPSGSTANLTSVGNKDIFIAKLDSIGAYVWAKQVGGTGAERPTNGNSLSVDTSGNVYNTGYFNGTVDFDPGVDTSNLISAGSDDIYVLKLDSLGNFVYVKQFGGTGSDQPNGLTLNSTNGYIYTTGYFNGTADFDPSSATANLTSAGGNDIFISRLIPDIVAPTFTPNSPSNITNTGVTITWTTNEVSSSIVEYGTTSNYGTTTTETDTGTPVTSHTVNLSNLTECTTYHYRVKSNDPSANLGTSSDSTFTTPGCSAVSVVLLQQMSDAMRQQESTVVLPPTTPTNTIVFCESGQIFNPNTGERCTSQTNTTSKFQFLKNLKYKDNNTDVKELQKFLNSHNFIISTTGAGSIGNETNYFGLATKNALIKFQLDNDIKPAVGYFGVITRAKVNSL